MDRREERILLLAAVGYVAGVMSFAPVITKRELAQQLGVLGVQREGVLLVHSAFSKLGPVEDGPRGLIDALLSAVGAGGTLVMPSMADDDDVPFDPARSACRAVGMLADTFWRMPGVLRSDSPHAFAACGALAARITRPHPVDVPHGLESPPGRVYELGGQVLLLGRGTRRRHDHPRRGEPRRQCATGCPSTRRSSRTDGRGATSTARPTTAAKFALLDDWLGQQAAARTRRPRRGAPRALARHRRRRARAPARGRNRFSPSRWRVSRVRRGRASLVTFNH